MISARWLVGGSPSGPWGTLRVQVLKLPERCWMQAAAAPMELGCPLPLQPPST